MPVIPIVPAKPIASADATAFFRNYTQLPSRVPGALWVALRAAVLGVTVALVALLVLRPERGLLLFWGLAVPVLPALLVLAPGLWRQVCPMATLNQLPRRAGFARGRELPPALKNAAFGIAVALFVTAVALRVPLFNGHGPAVGALVGVALVLALAGGWWFKGRSGWCGTFCPLGPVQRTYGQAPLVMVKNGYCEPCVGCQKNCYDFNPRAAVFSDLHDEDPRYAAQRRLFMGLLPGLVLGYFLQAASPGEPWQPLVLFGAAATSAGAYGLALAFLPVGAYRISLAFGALALAVFYVFAGPVIVRTLGTLLGAPLPDAVTLASQTTGAVLALVLTASGLHAERRWRATRAARGHADDTRTQVGSGAALKDRLASRRAAEVTDRQTGIAFQVAAGDTLLEGLEHAGLKMPYGCRAGVCGADPVAVCEGAEHLSPPGEDELATLRRLGLEGRARLACMCEVSGPVLIDRDARSATPAAVTAGPAVPAVDQARAVGLERVVIVGDGVAGMSAAEALRRASPSVAIDLVGNEPHGFYNRMGIGRLIHDQAGFDGLKLVPDDWPAAQRVKVWRGAVAARIDREGRRVLLADGTALPYQKLVLATGARSTPPDDAFLARENAFVLRSAEDAAAIRDHVQRRRARRAVVVGGGVLGVEAADALHKLGLKVVLLQRADRLMNQQLDEPGALRLATYLENIGIQVVTRVTVARWDGGRRLDAAWLSHGPRVRADVFVAALGIQPNSFLAEQAGLACSAAGIKVDPLMRSSDPDIFAIGDVADLKGTPRGLWNIGAAHAATAVGAMLGEPVPYATPRFVLQLKCDGIDLRSQGEIAAREGDEDLHAPETAEAWWRLVVRHGQIAGGLYVGPPGSGKAFTKLLQQPVDIAPLRAALRAGRLDGLEALLAR
jgi:nitrite reductase (NADH) large subunit